MAGQTAGEHPYRHNATLPDEPKLCLLCVPGPWRIYLDYYPVPQERVNSDNGWCCGLSSCTDDQLRDFIGIRHVRLLVLALPPENEKTFGGAWDLWFNSYSNEVTFHRNFLFHESYAENLNLKFEFQDLMATLGPQRHKRRPSSPCPVEITSFFEDFSLRRPANQTIDVGQIYVSMIEVDRIAQKTLGLFRQQGGYDLHTRNCEQFAKQIARFLQDDLSISRTNLFLKKLQHRVQHQTSSGSQVGITTHFRNPDTPFICVLAASYILIGIVVLFQRSGLGLGLVAVRALVTLHVLPRLEEYSLVPVEWIGRIGQIMNYIPRFYSSKVHFVIDFAGLARTSDLATLLELWHLALFAYDAMFGQPCWKSAAVVGLAIAYSIRFYWVQACGLASEELLYSVSTEVWEWLRAMLMIGIHSLTEGVQFRNLEQEYILRRIMILKLGEDQYVADRGSP